MNPRSASEWMNCSLMALLVTVLTGSGQPCVAAEPRAIDFNRDIRPILSNNCFQCHGPDEEERKADLRLDQEEGAASASGGLSAIVKGKPDDSEMIRRIVSTSSDEVMPPPATGKKLSAKEIELLKEWVRQGAPYAKHWSWVKPQRPELPTLKDQTWPKTPIDRFLLARLEKEGLPPSPEADRYTLIRRLSLDLTGLPPTVAEVDEFIADQSADAYEKLVDRLLKRPTYGEHWARMWLDLARYADSAGYADDPSRVIWGYRDWVIKAINRNMPFDQFTIEQIAGDLLPEPAPGQLIATAFHRNTLTNNEGGTNDEEFRNVAIVDRVNTTMAVWMGTTIACAQCHNHKYDPISQKEFFQLFAFFNNSQDADRRDESPLVELFTDEQLRQKTEWQQEVLTLEKTLSTSTPELLASQIRWEQAVVTEPAWSVLKGQAQSKAGIEIKAGDDGAFLLASAAATDAAATDTLTVELTAPAGPLTALQLQTLPHESLPGGGAGSGGGNFVISRVTATLTPPAGARQSARFVRVELPGKQKMLSLAEVQVFSGADNIALKGEATQSSTDYDGPAKLAIDGNTSGQYFEAKSTTHTAVSDNPWWELDLKSMQPVDRIVVWNRTDGGTEARLAGAVLKVLDDQRGVVSETVLSEPPKPSREVAVSSVREVPLIAAFADYSQASFEASSVINNKDTANRGWAVGGATGTPHQLTLIAGPAPEVAEGSKLTVRIEQVSKHEKHTLGHFRLAATSDPRISDLARIPPAILALVRRPAGQREAAQQAELTKYFLKEIAPELKTERERLAVVTKQLTELKPATTVPVMREMPDGQRRVTKLQHRGDWQNLGDEVPEGVPSAFHPLPEGVPRNRLALARWLVSEDNPLTARVIANRYWEALFGTGIVASSEEFGSQGEQPFHPELLDWLATEMVAKKWDTREFLKLLVMSAAYRQSSKVTPELFERDPENRLLARGPRFRLSAEMIRDQALAVAGLLSSKMYGAPVRPMQPSMGLNAAFGSGIDWQTSDGEDRYRRGLYTTWRRSNPYPSMAAFDAPNREVCTVRRTRTNTPLQALVTLNDPVYIEAAQALSRRILKEGGASISDRAAWAFKASHSRPASAVELDRLVTLFESVRDQFAGKGEAAMKLATVPLGPPPEGADVTELAAWTVVSNVLLNTDEMFMKR